MKNTRYYLHNDIGYVSRSGFNEKAFYSSSDKYAKEQAIRFDTKEEGEKFIYDNELKGCFLRRHMEKI